MFKKVLIISLILALSAITVSAAIDLGKINSAGKSIIDAMFGFAYWAFLGKSCYDCIKQGLGGNIKGAFEKGLGYALLFLLIQFLPTIFDLIRSIGGKF